MPLPVVSFTLPEVNHKIIHLLSVFSVEAFKGLGGYSRGAWRFVVFQLADCAGKLFHRDVGVQLGRLFSLSKEFSGICESFPFIVIYL